MALEILTAPSFPQLERHLLETLALRSAPDPVSPRWVVVPTALLARHLRLRLASFTDAGAVAGVRVTPLPVFVNQLASAYELKPGQRWGPEWDLLLIQLLAELPRRHPLSALKGPTAGTLGLAGTLRDLADAGFSADDHEALEEAIRSAESPSPVEAAVVGLFSRFAERVEECELNWQPFITRQLAERIEDKGVERLGTALECAPTQSPSVYLHGFYEWIDVNAQLIATLARVLPHVHIFFPFLKHGDAVHPTFGYAESVLEDLKARMGATPTTVHPLGERPEEPPETVRYFLSTFPEGDIDPDPPDFLTWRTASGLRAEVVSAAVAVRRAMDEGVEPEKILVLVPSADDYGGEVHEIFRTFSIPLRMVPDGEPLVPGPEPFQALSRIWQERAPAEWVLHYLRTVGTKRIPAAQGVDARKFEKNVRDAGLSGGRNWKSVLDFCRSQGNKTRDNTTFSDAELTFIEKVHRFWVEEPERQGDLSIDQATERLNTISQEWFTGSDALTRLVRCLAGLQKPLKGARIPQWMLIELVAGLTARPEESEESEVDLAEPALSGHPENALPEPDPDPFDSNRKAVLVAPFMRARGMTGSAVVLMGMDADRFPRRIDEDPLLSDPAKRRLSGAARDLGHRLTVRSGITEEMALLFHLVNTSAGRVTWVIPVADASGRSVAPSPWIQRYLEPWTTDRKQLLSQRRMPRSPVEQARLLCALMDERSPPAHGLLPPAFAVLLQRTAGRALPDHRDLMETLGDLDERRRGVPQWNGVPRNFSPKQPLSVTALETLAHCPFKFYAERVAELEELPILELIGSLQADFFGVLAHSILEQALEKTIKEQKTGSLSELRDLALAAVEKVLPAVEARAGGVRLAVLPEVFRRAELDRVLERVRDYLHHVGREPCPDGQPVQFERRTTADYGKVRISGKFDRVDTREGKALLLDYKTGRPKTRKSLDAAARAGWMLQPTLYPWLYHKTNPSDDPPGFSVIYLRTPEEVPVEPSDPEALLDQFMEIVKNRCFVPVPTGLWKQWEIKEGGQCRWCKLASVCRRLDVGAVQRFGAIYKEWASKRLGALTADKTGGASAKSGKGA